MNIESLCKRVTEFGFTLLEAGFALDAKQHKVKTILAKRKSLIWVRGRDGTFVSDVPPKVSDYLYILENQEYSYLMLDGSVIQIAFIYDGDKVAQHRLVYHPCPFLIDQADLQAFGGGLLEFINDAFMNNLEQSMLLRSPIRFDFAPKAAKDFHPASHITINSSECRIPARAPLQFDTFIKFVLENFYAEAWQHSAIAKVLSFREEEECLSAHDKGRAYVTWAYPK